MRLIFALILIPALAVIDMVRRNIPPVLISIINCDVLLRIIIILVPSSSA